MALRSLLVFLLPLLVRDRTDCVPVISDAELSLLSERMFSMDSGNHYADLALNIGRQIARNHSISDYSPERLFPSGDLLTQMNESTIRTLVSLYDNFVPYSTSNEVHTAQENREQVNFIDALMKTEPMTELRAALVKKGFFPPDLNQFKRQLKRMWFNFYGRHRTVNSSSSGFEHVFLGETKNGVVSGFHNWIYFYYSEMKGNINYFGYKKKIDILSQDRKEQKAILLKVAFSWLENAVKPTSTMLVGTSPELEIGLYTLCFVTRPNGSCHVQLGGRRLQVKTYVYSHLDQQLIGSAYFDI